MTREEQIKREAEAYGWTGSQFDIQTAFIRGANWADEHPKFNKVEFIKKTIDWIVMNYGDYYDGYGEYFYGLEMAEDLQHHLEKEI